MKVEKGACSSPLSWLHIPKSPQQPYSRIEVICCGNVISSNRLSQTASSLPTCGQDFADAGLKHRNAEMDAWGRCQRCICLRQLVIGRCERPLSTSSLRKLAKMFDAPMTCS